MIILIYVLRRIEISEWKVFSLLYILLVIAFIIITPFNTAYDEAGHFTRAYEVSRGRMVSQHNTDGSGISLIPAESAYIIQTSVLEHENFLYKYDKNAKSVQLSGEEAFITNENQALYSPVSYIPQAIGLRIADSFTDTLYYIYQGGRFFAALVNMLFVLLAM